MIVTLRNGLFDLGLFKSKKFPLHVISVGNLSVGGTGKTPTVAAVVEHLLQKRKRVAIVSRGYGGVYKEEAVRVNVEQDRATELYGDEPVWFAKKLGVPVHVGRKRSLAVENALRFDHPEVIVCDDGFQHRWLWRNKDIVLIDCMEANSHLLPRGRFREPLSSLKRASIVILTKTNQVSPQQLLFWKSKVEQFGFTIERKNLIAAQHRLGKMELVRGVESIDKNDQVLLASSIAQPSSFSDLLSGPYNIFHHFCFKDHFAWNQDEVDKIEKYAVDHRLKHLVVTEKDFVKLEDLVFKYVNLHVAVLEMVFSPGFENDTFF